MKVKSIAYNWGQFAEHYPISGTMAACAECEGTYTVGKNGVLGIMVTADETEARVEFENKLIVQRNINRIVYEKE